MKIVTTDVVIVGGGIIGCSTAWRLAQRGLKVTVLESTRIGSEASRAGAGMLAPGGEAGPESKWARRMVESLALYPDYVSELEEASGGTRIEFRICGAHEYAIDDDHWQTIQRRAALQSELGIVSEIESGPRRIFYPNDGIVKPSHVVRALVEAAGKLGVVFREHSPVTAIDRASGTVSVSGHGDYTAGAIVLAAGAWASQMVGGIPPAFPVKGHLIGYRMEPGSLPRIERRNHHYILQRQCGFTIVGSTSETVGFDRTVDLNQVARLDEETRRYVPSLPKEWEAAWVGFRPGINGEPQVERFEQSRLWLSYGHFRNGILLAPLTAQMLADQITAAAPRTSLPASE